MHKLIALWSHPRSMSTATERIMRERGDLDCAHEPFMYDYYLHRKVREMPHFDPEEGHPLDYDSIRDDLLDRAKAGPVFFKDMAYYVVPRLLSDDAFRDRLTHAFLVRDPVASILSYQKLDPDLTMEEIGIEAQWTLYQALVSEGRTPPVILAEDVRADPQAVIGAMWREVGLDFLPGAFDWQSPPPDDWDQVGDWHGSVSNSTGIRPLTDAERDKQRAAFETAAGANPALRDMLARHRPCYERFAEVAVKT